MGMSLFLKRVKLKRKTNKAKPPKNPQNPQPNQPKNPKKQNKTILHSSQCILGCKSPGDVLLLWCKLYHSCYCSHFYIIVYPLHQSIKDCPPSRCWVSTSANSSHRAACGYIASKSKAGSLQANWEHLLKPQYHHRGDPPQYTVARQGLTGQADLGSNPVSREKEWILHLFWRGQRDSHTRRSSRYLTLTSDFPANLWKPKVLWSTFFCCYLCGSCSQMKNIGWKSLHWISTTIWSIPCLLPLSPAPMNTAERKSSGGLRSSHLKGKWWIIQVR